MPISTPIILASLPIAIVLISPPIGMPILMLILLGEPIPNIVTHQLYHIHESTIVNHSIPLPLPLPLLFLLVYVQPVAHDSLHVI